MDHLTRIRQITRDYPSLQGLRALPLGLFFLVIAMQRLEMLPWFGGEGDLSFTLPLLAVVIGLWFWFGRYYENTFGKVEPLRKSIRSTVLNIAFPIGFVGIIILENRLYASNGGPRISLIGLVLGATFLYSGWMSQRWYYSLAGIVLLIASFLPWMIGVGIENPVYGSMGIIHLFLLGGIILLTGLFDHFCLVRAFARTQGGFHVGDA